MFGNCVGLNGCLVIYKFFLLFESMVLFREKDWKRGMVVVFFCIFIGICRCLEYGLVWWIVFVKEVVRKEYCFYVLDKRIEGRYLRIDWL